MSRRPLSSRLLVAPFPGVFIRRSVAYWVLLHLMRAVILAFGGSMGGRALTPVLSAATPQADRGVVTALVGRNGCGKSTLLRIMAGLMAPDYGHLRFRGQGYARTRLPRLAREGLFLLPADRSILVRTLTFRQQLDAMRRRFDLRAGDQVLEELKITHLLDRSPDGCSGGERRRAELALAVIRAPACLLADEPFLGITPADTEVFIAAFRRLAQCGTAIVVTGHEVPFILAVADRVTWIDAGTTRPLGDPESAKRDWLFRRDYLGIRAV